jgi:hypothetical protein
MGVWRVKSQMTNALGLLPLPQHSAELPLKHFIGGDYARYAPLLP